MKGLGGRTWIVNQQVREDIARMLLGAYSSCEPVEPLTAQYQELTVEDAYAIQLLQVRDWLAAGAQVRGHKASGNSPGPRPGSPGMLET
jgi:2-keto-4-pentenoate hydratase